MPIRAVIYARCSTEEEKQKNALSRQVEEAKACVERRGWLLTDTYVESRSGTTSTNRTEYNRLFRDLSLDVFDIIVIKSQDRLMRNTKDWYLFLDQLVGNAKKLYMYLDHSFYTPDDALLTGIKAILAEEYSRELSKKINNAHRNRQRKGEGIILTSNTYGYRKGPDKEIVIVEDEALIKRKMYQLCAGGYGSRAISRILQTEGILNRKGNPFTPASILRIIRSPLNKGTVVMNSIHYDFNTRKTIKVPKDQQFIHEHKIPAIVSEELWEAANNAIERRNYKNHGTGTPGLCTSPEKSIFSGRIFCGLCKAPYYRTTRKAYGEKGMIAGWRCRTYLETGRISCDNIHLEEEKLMLLLEGFSRENISVNHTRIIDRLIKVLETVLTGREDTELIQELEKKQRSLEKQTDVLLDKLLEGLVSDEQYQRKQGEIRACQEAVEEKLKGVKPKQHKIKSKIEEIRILLEKGDIIQRAAVFGMVEEMTGIWVYPTYMELCFGPKKVRVEFGALFDYRAKKREERERIIEMMKENPYITAKQIAEIMGTGLSGANYRIAVLKKEGRIRFLGKGGKGMWEVRH